MESIHLQFGQGIEPPAKLGTAIIKPVSEGKFSYGQNVDVENDEYGNTVLLPGPALNTITGNANLIGVPFIRAFDPNPGRVGDGNPVIFLGEHIVGTTSTVGGVVTGVASGVTPTLQATTYSLSHSGHGHPKVDDMEYWDGSGAIKCYSIGQDDTDQWYVSQASGGGTYQNYVTLTGAGLVAQTFEQKIWNSKNDGFFYFGYNYNIDRLTPNNGTYFPAVLGLTQDKGITAFEDWLTFLAIAVSTEYPYTFAKRKGAGKSGIYLWDLTSTAVETRRFIPCPARYISALKRLADGTLIAFGGVNEGKTTLYQFNGYGFTELYTYIGDMPLNRHSVDLDGQGRILWQTVDGQICRYDITKNIFTHLGTMNTNTSQGGILMKLLGGTGNEFLVASGTGTSYTLAIMSFGNYVGDGASTNDVFNTPLAVSGLADLPQKSVIRTVIVSLQTALTQGNRIEVRLYPNGSTNYTVLGNLQYSDDGAVASKQVRCFNTGNDNAAIGLAWKTADNSTTAPGVVDVELQYNKINTL